MAGETTTRPAAVKGGSHRHHRRLHVLLALALIACATGGHALLRQRAERIELNRHADARRKDLAMWEARRNAVEAELTAAREQLAEIESLRASATGTKADPNSLDAWLARERRLRELVKEQPDQVIPEFQLLTDDDWLRVARDARLDTPEHRRRALAALRDAAKRHFQYRLSKAMEAFLRHSKVDRPATMSALAPYFEMAPDPAMLARYAVVSMETPTGNPFVLKVIEEIAPIDPDYDSRFSIAKNSAPMVHQAPEAWIPDFEARNHAALTTFEASNPGLHPESRSALLPYSDPPLDPVLVEKILRGDRERPNW